MATDPPPIEGYEPSYIVLENLYQDEPDSSGGLGSYADQLARPSGGRFGMTRFEFPSTHDTPPPRTPRKGKKKKKDLKVITGVSEEDANEASKDPANDTLEIVGTTVINPFRNGNPPIDPPDPEGMTWGIAAVQADKSRFTGEGVKVAVLDSGIDTQHAAFAGVVFDNKDFTGEGIADQNGHGTHCAATIFGRPIDDIRIGVAPGVTEAMIVKVLDKNLKGKSDTLVKGIHWALAHNADVICMSLCLDHPEYMARLKRVGAKTDVADARANYVFAEYSRVFDSLFVSIRERDRMGLSTIVFAAAGNESDVDGANGDRRWLDLPGAAKNVISVGALTHGAEGLAVAPFSNRGPRVSAPGVAVTSAKAGGGLTAMSGTSMACPHAAGVAALWAEKLRREHPSATSERIERNILTSAVRDVFGSAVNPADIGEGLVQAPLTAPKTGGRKTSRRHHR